MIHIRSLPLLLARRSILPGLCAALLASTVLPAHAQTADEAARAAALEAEGKALRAEADATYEATVPGCYEKFFVNRCIDQAKKQRLETIRRARELEAEGRRLTLAERQRAAAAKPATGEAPNAPPPPTALPASPALAPAAPSGNAAVAPSPAAERIRAERIRAERAEASREAEAAAARQRAVQDAERAAARRDAEDAAARRARQAEEDRARYEKRLRDYEQEQAGKK
jgi:colicin import membrane protein